MQSNIPIIQTVNFLFLLSTLFLKHKDSFVVDFLIELCLLTFNIKL